MPSNYTANYKLNQWERSDKVQMEDFNADNVKIDAAVKAQADAIAAETTAREKAVSAEVSARTAAVKAVQDACPLVVLRSVTLTSNTTNYSLSLTGFNWEEYGEVTIYMLLKSASAKILLNNLSGTTYYYDWSVGPMEQFAQVSGTCSIVCRVYGRTTGFYAEWQDRTWWAEPRHYFYRQDSTARTDIRTMNFVGSLGAGTRLTILGVRA